MLFHAGRAQKTVSPIVFSRDEILLVGEMEIHFCALHQSAGATNWWSYCGTHRRMSAIRSREAPSNDRWLCNRQVIAALISIWYKLKKRKLGMEDFGDSSRKPGSHVSTKTIYVHVFVPLYHKFPIVLPVKIAECSYLSSPFITCKTFRSPPLSPSRGAFYLNRSPLQIPPVILSF